MSVRKPAYAGKFYPAEVDALNSIIEKSFMNKFGPGRMPGHRERKRTFGVIAPHAGYMFSGPGAAKCYKEIAESKIPDTFVMLGVNHSMNKTCVSDQDWETPLGVVKSDKEFVDLLVSKGVELDNSAHASEHSIEVQLPFLQFACKEELANVRVACIMVSDADYSKWAEIIEGAAKELGREMTIICSSDFTHYGDNYGYTPFDGNVRDEMEKLDMGAVVFIKKKNPSGFLEYCDKTGATICGKNGIALLIKLVEKKKYEFLGYYTSGDVIGNYGTSVGYASVLFR